MVTSPYDISNAMKGHTGLSDSTLYDDLAYLLSKRDWVSEVGNSMKGAGTSAINDVLRMIVESTFGWCKPFEFLRTGDFGNSRQQNGCGSSTISARTSRRILKLLLDAGYIVRFNAQLGNRMHYALNLEKVMPIVRDAINAKPAESTQYKDSRTKCAAILASKDYVKLTAFIKTFAGEVYGGIKDFLAALPSLKERVAAALVTVKEIAVEVTEKIVETVKNAGGKAVANLSSNVRAAKAAARETSNRIETRRIERPRVAGQDMDARAALALWHKEVRDTEEYSGYLADSTGKTCGQMGKWLKELRADDKTDDEIRFLIRQIVRKWQHVDERDKEFTRISQKGFPCKVRMNRTPNFRYFFANRTELQPILAQTCEPDKHMDGTDRGYYEYV